MGKRSWSLGLRQWGSRAKAMNYDNEDGRAKALNYVALSWALIWVYL
jgi:hypothetical protein